MNNATDTSGGVDTTQTVIVYRRVMRHALTGEPLVVRGFPERIVVVAPIDIDDLFADMKRLNGFARTQSWGMPVPVVWKMPRPNAIRLKNRPIRIVRRVLSPIRRGWRWQRGARCRR